MSKTMRVNDNSYNKLEELSEETGYSKQDLIALAIEEFSRKIFFNKVNQAYNNLKNDSLIWQDTLEERDEWENINDNLDNF